MTKSNNKQLREQERNSLQSTCMGKSGFFCHNYFLTVDFFLQMLVLATFFPTSDVSAGHIDFIGVGQH